MKNYKVAWDFPKNYAYNTNAKIRYCGKEVDGIELNTCLSCVTEGDVIPAPWLGWNVRPKVMEIVVDFMDIDKAVKKRWDSVFMFDKDIEPGIIGNIVCLRTKSGAYKVVDYYEVRND